MIELITDLICIPLLIMIPILVLGMIIFGTIFVIVTFALHRVIKKKFPDTYQQNRMFANKTHPYAYSVTFFKMVRIDLDGRLKKKEKNLLNLHERLFKVLRFLSAALGICITIGFLMEYFV